MRSTNNSAWLRSEGSDVVIGLNLGADFVAEHEWGIKGLKNLLGCPQDGTQKLYGIERRRCKAPNPSAIRLFEADQSLNLLVCSPHNVDGLCDLITTVRCRPELQMRGDTMRAAWQEDSLLVRVSQESEKAHLRELHAALVAGDVAIWLGGGGFFENAGLCLAVIDRLPAKSKKVMEDADRDYEALQAASAKTGIKARIDEYNQQWRNCVEVETGRHCFETAPCEYFALTPRWKGSGDKTKHAVVFWLNPQGQDVNDHGWYTVEELDLWLRHEGPVLKNKKRRAACV